MIFADVRLERRRHGHGAGVGAAAPERGDRTALVDPWKPATTATYPSFSALGDRLARIWRIRAFTYAASVSTGIWKPQNDFALHPISVSAIASSPIVTCSPVAATTSSSRSFGISESWFASPSSRFVSPDIAETTTTTSFPSAFVRPPSSRNS